MIRGYFTAWAFFVCAFRNKTSNDFGRHCNTWLELQVILVPAEKQVFSLPFSPFNVA